MKAKILKSNFAKAMNQVSKIASNRTTLPVLNNILIEFKDGKVKFSATDLELGITTSAIAKIEEEGKITLPARLLNDFVNNNKDESIDVSVEKLSATLKSDHFEAKIMGISDEEFPTIPILKEDGLIKINKADLLDALKKVSIATATDETRPVLAGVMFKFIDKELILAATDSYRLAEKKIKLIEEAKETSIIVPNRTILEVLRLLSLGEGKDEVNIYLNENQIAFKLNDTFVVSRLIEGSFPDYRQIIPSEFKTEVKAKLSDINGAVKMASLFAKDSANNNIKIKIEDNKLTIFSADSQTASAKSDLQAEVKGDGLEIAFNAKYIADVLNVLLDSDLVIKFNLNSSPGLIESQKDKDYTYIIMPLKLDD